MVWLAKWIREHIDNARVLLITDRTELDEQIEKVFKGVNESIYRTKSGADLIATLNDTNPSLICSLVHKFGHKNESKADEETEEYIAELKSSITKDFQAKGDIFVFVDECHRTQSGKLHNAMKAFLPSALFIGFTGTPLLKEDKKTSLETFGPYIHTYKFDEAVNRLDAAIRCTKKADWIGDRFKERELLSAIRKELENTSYDIPTVFELIKQQREYH